MTTRRFGLLFHFTHLNNLPEILGCKELLADTEVQARGLLRQEAGNLEIKERRRTREVLCPPGGVVADYVPFYFAARAPMMLTIKNGNVPSFSGHHTELVYLVSEVASAADTGLPCVVSDRNAAVGLAEFSNDLRVLGDLGQPMPDCSFVDWEVMNLTYWHNVAAYPDRMERRMAEFLVYQRFPLDALIGAGVHNDAIRGTVERMFERADLGIRVRVRPDWYY